VTVAFLITSPYQIYHYQWIACELPDVVAVLEVRDREYGLSADLVAAHLPEAEIEWVTQERLSRLDGRFAAIVCQTPILPLTFLDRTPVVAQQYSLAKERYQYGVWRAHARLNLMYGDYPVHRVAGFCQAVAVGNPLLDPYFREPAPQRLRFGAPGRRPRLLYLPTYGDLSSLPAVLPYLSEVDAELTVKLHHAAEPLASLADSGRIRVVGPEADPVSLLRSHDGVLSDISGAAYDALYAGLPVVLTPPAGTGPSSIRWRVEVPG
jgi:hypothetical protein